MKIALVYDRINKIGGAEKVLQAMHQLWPDAPLFTSVYQSSQAKWARSFQVFPSFLNSIPFVPSHHEWFAWAMPYVFESFNFDHFDVVISVTSAEAKGILTKPGTLHLSYLLTPTRYLWSHTHLYRSGDYATTKNIISRCLTPWFFSSLRCWDQIASSRPDRILAISNTVSSRIIKYYRRNPDAIIYPPVENFSEVSSDQSQVYPAKYFLIVSRLVPYKRIDLAIRAFKHLDDQLIIIGDGAQKNQLKKLAPPNVKILGMVSQSKLAGFYQNCRALIFPSEEDFGIVCVEAQSVGKPVIAFARGGAAETIIPGKTGILFRDQSVKSLVRAIKRFKTQKFHPQVCKANAKQFSVEKFKQSLLNYVESSWQLHQNKFQ